MSGLQEFLTPFSHLIFANRDKVFALLWAQLAWFNIQLLTTRWRNERRERALSAAKSGGPGGGRRRYAASPPADESHAEGGALPPVKGGRTYARNLGTALQKAGISGPQIYSPPTPAGWAPNANPAQAGPPQPQPGMASPYTTPNAPWAAPTPPPPSPWGFPAGAGRPMPGAQPGQAPPPHPQRRPPTRRPLRPRPRHGSRLRRRPTRQRRQKKSRLRKRSRFPCRSARPPMRRLQRETQRQNRSSRRA